MIDLSLRYEDNGTAHDDLLLRFSGQTKVCDSYYFALDRNIEPSSESPSKIKAVLRALLEQWLAAVSNLQDAGTAFLPYDFSDQYTGWLCCKRNRNEMVVSLGWSLAVQGHWIFPSAVGEYISQLPDYEAEGPAMKPSKDELLLAIRDSLAAAA